MKKQQGKAQETVQAGATGIEAADSLSFIGRWNRLVSTTNWEKGRIIFEWRTALAESGAPIADYSDEAWSRLVGGVTGQHVGRLRRVFHRFDQSRERYPGLYWSHFQAALEWDDAEMWLEGAVQSDWSVSQMRNTRWETLGAVEADRPREEDAVAAEMDEDFEPAQRAEPSGGESSALPRTFDHDQTGPRIEGPDFGDEEARISPPVSPAAGNPPQEDVQFVRPFAGLRALPDDVVEAFEGFKLAILRHKSDGWQQLSADEMLATLDALKELVLAPSAESPPF